ncbi:MAG: ElyC/SanA/YdcF family protein [Anaerolineae bacterium]|nr:YdcF family protein [Thermoflexales bacterium]MDW8408147.1 ElyC/SanA/YdcF family protein [Anaerolineae bacterium]
MIKKVMHAAVVAAIVLTMLPLMMRWVVGLWARDRVHELPTQVPPQGVAIVFGAGVRGERPTPMLYDRVASAVELYKAGRVHKLLMSGDNRFANYNEPRVMRKVALELGVPEQDIVSDYAGRSTYETCYRARDIFGVTSAVLVTQRFHLDRALMVCNALGVEAAGYAADRRPYRHVWWNELREIPALLNAFVQVYVTRPLPVLGEEMPIDAS